MPPLCTQRGHFGENLFNGNAVLSGQGLLVLLGQGQHQDAAVIFGIDLLGLHIAHIEAAAASAAVPLLADVAAPSK